MFLSNGRCRCWRTYYGRWPKDWRAEAPSSERRSQGGLGYVCAKSRPCQVRVRTSGMGPGADCPVLAEKLRKRTFGQRPHCRRSERRVRRPKPAVHSHPPDGKVGAVSRTYAVRTTDAKSGHLRPVQRRRIVSESLSAARARSRSENTGLAHLHLDRMATREEQINGEFKVEVQRH